jgi:putative SOS response-associated peptidase YedK
MCGRFQQDIQSAEVADYFRRLSVSPRTPNWKRFERWQTERREQAETWHQRRFNVTPTGIAVSALGGSEGLRFGPMTWGWQRDFLAKSRHLINARGEEAANKPTWSTALRARRCLIPATAFYEWRESDKQPYSFHQPGHEPFMIGALWERPADAEYAAFVLLTTEANALVTPIHHRMAHMLAPETWDAWLDPTTPFDDILALIRPYPIERMEAYPIRRRIAKAAETDPIIAEPCDEGTD